MEQRLIEDFKARKIKAKSIFHIEEIEECDNSILDERKYHYLADAKFFAVYSYGLYCKNELVGVATYSNLQGTNSLNGWFGITDNSYPFVLELSRLAMLPALNGTNATSFLLGNSLRMLNKNKGVRAVTTLATSDRHIGSIYQVCNFEYYGKTDKKTEFFEEVLEKGEQHDRGVKRNKKGVWVNKPQKHRYAYIFDKTLKCLYDKQPYPSKDSIQKLNCCGGTNIVHDSRYNVDYLCPICNGWNNKLVVINDYQQDKQTEIIHFFKDKQIEISKFVVNFFLKSEDVSKEMEEIYRIIINKLESEKYNIDYDVTLFGTTINNVTYK